MGNSCNFAHEIEELNDAPDLTKTSLCVKFMEGRQCKDAAACPFAHGQQELRMTPMFNIMRKQKPTQEKESPPGFLDPPDDTSKLQAKQPGIHIQEAPGHVSLEVTRGPPGTFNFSKGDASWNAECGGTLNNKMPHVFMLSPSGRNGKHATVLQSADPSAEDNPHAVQDSMLPVFFQGPHHPSSMQALERLLQSAMPDCYED